MNNPTADDEEALHIARQKGWKVLGQLERGLKDGTPHYQIRLQTPQVRFSAVKKVFRRGHIEPAREAAALARYVTKEETRVGDLPVQQDTYPSLSKFWDLVFDYLNGLGKDGLDYVELESDVVCMFRPENDRVFKKSPLIFLDRAAGDMISRGYHVESLAANPSTRSMWKLFHMDIILRSYRKKRIVDDEHNQNADDDQTSQWSSPSQELSRSCREEGEQASLGETDSQSSSSNC